jgi:hypothetical protein
MALAIAARGWITDLDCAIPDAAVTGNGGWGADARLIVYVLAWVSRSLRSAGAQLFDPPIGYPAPGALTGSEHFLGVQLLFTPIVTLTRNVVLAANLTTLVSYWAAAFVPFLLLRRHGFGIVPAMTAGVVTAFGPLQVPADLHQLQFPGWGVPLVLLAGTTAAATPSRRATLAFAGALALACLTSYQLAANAVMATALLATFQPVGRHPWRAYAAGLGAAAAMLLAVSLPYVARLREPGVGETAHMVMGPDSGAMMARFVTTEVDRWWAALGVVGAAAGIAVRRTRRVALLGLALAVCGAILACGWSTTIGDVVVPLPYALFAKLPGSMVVQPPRFLVLTGAGLGILAGCAVGALHDLLGGARIAAAVATVALGAVATHGLAAFVPPATTCLPIARRVPETYAWLAAHPGGAVRDARGGHPLPPALLVDAASAMLGSLVHGHPVLEIHSHHVPPGSALVNRLAREPPTRASLEALVDMTHLRWILLRPSGDDVRDDAWSALPGVAPAASLPDGRIYEVRIEPRHVWFDALSAGPRPDRTLLGTALAPVADPRARLAVSRLPPAVPRASSFAAPITIVNDGATAWPVSAPAGAADARIVSIRARWDGGGAHHQTIELPYDVEPGTTLEVPARLAAPPAPGHYTVTLELAQGQVRFATTPAAAIEVR